MKRSVARRRVAFAFAMSGPDQFSGEFKFRLSKVFLEVPKVFLCESRGIIVTAAM